ncbi:unnamed protein product [Effrenium voratum]|nr:unnamed protein product [Effrenium voratum]
MGVHRALLRVLGFEALIRSRASTRPRVLVYACGEILVRCIMLLGDWIIVHFLLVDFATTITLLLGSDANVIKQWPLTDEG